MLKKISLAMAFGLLFPLAPCVGGTTLAAPFSCQPPALITSAGQSMEVKMVSMVCKKIGLANECDSLATPSMLSGKKTLIIVPGVSLKGMGTAGVDIGAENTRIAQLCAKARQQGIKVVLVHTGGTIRRGPVNDPVIEETLAGADVVVVCKEGNQDQFFTTQCRKRNIPMIEIANISDLPKTLKALFQID